MNIKQYSNSTRHYVCIMHHASTSNTRIVQVENNFIPIRSEFDLVLYYCTTHDAARKFLFTAANENLPEEPDPIEDERATA